MTRIRIWSFVHPGELAVPERRSLTPTALRILDAADRLLGRFGFRRMTIDDLAKEAGIGKGTVYLSFRSKEDVALACIDRMVRDLLAALESIAREDRPAPERLHRMLVLRVVHRFDYARHHHESIDELLAALRPRLLERRAQHFAAETRVLAAVVAQGTGAGTLTARSPRATAEAMILATNALLPYSLGVRELGRRAEIVRRAARVADLVLHGVIAAPSGARKSRTTGVHDVH
jgi:AcrR family transcriptional regulator